MRKSTVFSMCIIFVALVGMMVAADLALKPVKRDLAVGRDLTAELEARGDIEPGTKAVTVARRPEARHLAKEGWGMIVELQPSRAVLTRKGRLQNLAYRAARTAGSLYAQGPGHPLEWFEIRMLVGGQTVGKTLIPVDEAGQLGRQDPPLPDSVPAHAGS
jgi:hypothetical protein